MNQAPSDNCNPALAGILQRPTLLCFAIGAIVIALRLALLPVMPIPVPVIHDEFSYLLGAETFASGRITNPPHPMWVHFETFHVNMLPTYCSKYPPAQALTLAFGQVLFGQAWFGVCLSAGLMIAAFCWMLQGWVSPKAALLTTALAGIWCLSTYWMNSYWGGAVAALGGALLIGAVPRLARRIAIGPALAASAGIAVLANSRPYEGSLTVISSAAVLAWWLRREKRPLRALLDRRLIAPLVLVMLPVIAAMALYNYRATGNPILFPYAVNQKTYAASPHFYILPSIPEPAYRHESIRRFWEWDRKVYQDARSNPLNVILSFSSSMGPFYLFNPWGALAILGVLLGCTVETGFAALILLLPIFGLLLAKGVLPHYLAPVSGVLWILTAMAFERIARWWRGARKTRVLAILCFGGVSFGYYAAQILHVITTPKPAPQGVATRPLLIERLAKEGKRHLVIVHYGGAHYIHAEWVYNHADIDHSDVVWARDMGRERNRELLDYFRDRQAWLLEPDVDPLKLEPYPR